MARHKDGDSGERRTCGFTVQFTPTERGELDRRASARGLSVSDFIRSACLGRAVADAPALSRRDPERMALVNELSRLGNNLNQIAHRANAGGQVRIEEGALALLEEIAAALERVVP